MNPLFACTNFILFCKHLILKKKNLSLFARLSLTLINQVCMLNVLNAKIVNFRLRYFLTENKLVMLLKTDKNRGSPTHWIAICIVFILRAKTSENLRKPHEKYITMNRKHLLSLDGWMYALNILFVVNHLVMVLAGWILKRMLLYMLNYTERYVCRHTICEPKMNA